MKALIKDLEQEAAVCSHQRVKMPVFLGAIDFILMNKIHYYDNRVYVVHMTFPSWGGCGIALTQAHA